ncbi:MAG: hypothetical protein KJ811_00215, partial [Candidatus Margulisbacteria bacterium]|nr:hypothetical protein [Candidatus Margulisiibacteriota bacterium]
MLSTLAIISIFTEIFAAGILVAGAGAFFKRFFALKKTADLFLGLVFFCLFIYVSATIASQMLFNLGREVSLLIFIHKIIYISLAFCAVMIWFYVIEHFELTKLRWTRVLILLLAAVLVFFVLTASTSLIYREDIIEPIVSFAFYLPVKPFLVFAWLFFALVALLKAAVDRRADRAISVFLGAAAVVMLLGMLSSILYVNFGEAVYLIASWFLVLLSTLAFLAAGLVPADSPEAHYPWLFFRTRILFKLMLIFVLLIVILFEATTLATINISKHALSQSIIKNYLRVAEDFADEVQLFTELPSKRFIQKLVSSSKINGQEMAFLVNKNGRLLAHPDEKRALSLEDVSLNEGVQRALEGKFGGGEFRDELGVQMVGAYVPIQKFGWGIVVQEPLVSAYSELRRLETNSLLFVVVGIV